MSDRVHVTFIHGVANKPTPQDLRRIWLEALALAVSGDEGFDLGEVGVTASFVYWADLFFDAPIPASQYESRKDELEASVPDDPDLSSDEWTAKFKETYGIDDESAFEDPPVDESVDPYERIPIPWFIKRRVLAYLTEESHDYLFNVDGIRDTIWSRVREDFGNVPADTRHVVVGHSLGSVIAYDCVTAMPSAKEVHGLLTLGSPLGIDEVQDRLGYIQDNGNENGFPANLKGDWANVYDSFDIVARADPKLANDFKKDNAEVVADINEQNWGPWRHSATKYFKGPELRRAFRRLCDREGA